MKSTVKLFVFVILTLAVNLYNCQNLALAQLPVSVPLAYQQLPNRLQEISNSGLSRDPNVLLKQQIDYLYPQLRDLNGYVRYLPNLLPEYVLPNANQNPQLALNHQLGYVLSPSGSLLGQRLPIVSTVQQQLQQVPVAIPKVGNDRLVPSVVTKVQPAASKN